MNEENQQEYYFLPPNGKPIGTMVENYDGAIEAFTALLEANNYSPNPITLEEFVLTREDFELSKTINITNHAVH